AIRDEGREGLQHLGEKFGLKDGADHGQAEHGFMPPIAAGWSSHSVAGEQNDEADEGDDGPPPFAAELAGGDEELGDEWELLASFSK
ncbi:MAG: hypothetical protein ACK55I_18105, partial [bacterium]